MYDAVIAIVKIASIAWLPTNDRSPVIRARVVPNHTVFTGV
jgi:hypothetical protein